MTSLQVVKDDEGKGKNDEKGQTFIPASQRPDGTWRKPIRVKAGYVPQEEQPVYVSKGRNSTTPGGKGPYPVGLSAEDMTSSSKLPSFPVGYFDSVELMRQAAGIPGLNFVKGSDPLVPTKSKSKSKKKKDSSSTTTASDEPNITSKPSSTSASSTSQSQPQPSTGTDPAKRLRNLKKKLKEIEELEKKIASGELTSPEKEQLEKLKRKQDVEDEMEELEKLIDSLNVS